MNNPDYGGVFRDEYFAEPSDLLDTVKSLGDVCTIAGNTQLELSLSLDDSAQRRAYADLLMAASNSSADVNLSRSFLPLKGPDWSSRLNMDVGTFLNYTAVQYRLAGAARKNHDIMSNLRNTEWQFEEEYVYEGIFPTFFLFVGLGALQVIILPIWLYMYKRGKFSGWCACCTHRVPSRRTVKIAMVFILSLALICILMAIGGATRIHQGMSNASDETCLASLLLNTGAQISSIAGNMGVHMINTTETFLNTVIECARVPVDPEIPRSWEKLADDARKEMTKLSTETSKTLSDLGSDALYIGNELSKASDVLLWVLVVSSCVLLFFFVIITLASAVPLLYPSKKGKFATFHKCLTCVLNPLGFLVLALLWVFVGLGFSFGVFTGDYCQDPNENLASIPLVEGEGQYIRYYSTCEGETDITKSLELAREYTVRLAQQVVEPMLDFIYDDELLNKLCPDVDLVDLGENSALALIGSYMLLVLASAITSCATVNPLYNEIVYESVCQDFPKGALFLSISYLLGGIAMCVCAVLSAVLVKRATIMHKEQYYPRLTMGEETQTSYYSNSGLEASNPKADDAASAAMISDSNGNSIEYGSDIPEPLAPPA